jgi:hypothetical protein
MRNKVMYQNQNYVTDFSLKRIRGEFSMITLLYQQYNDNNTIFLQGKDMFKLHFKLIILSRSTCDCWRGLNWGMDLLTPCTHDSEVQAITVTQLISKIHNSPQNTLNVFQSPVSSPAIPLQRLLTVKILQLHALKSSLHRFPNTTDLVTPVFLKITPRHGPRRRTPFPTWPLLRVGSLLRERVYRAVA